MAHDGGLDVDATTGAQAEDAEEGLAASLRVLANARRLRLLRFLATPATLEDVAKELGIARQNAHDHVMKLVDEGFVQLAPEKASAHGANAFVVVPQRLFALEQDLAAVGRIDAEPGDAQARARTHALDGSEPGPKERDLPRLVIVQGWRVGGVLTLSGDGPWLIGREPTAALCLDYDPFVSVRHAEVRRVGDTFEVVDLYSSNGTALEWDRLPRGSGGALANGAVVRVGRTMLLFRQGA